MTISELLFSGVDALRVGDFLSPDRMAPILDDARDQLEDWLERLEQEPKLTGLEPLDSAFREAIEIFFEAVDYLELAVEENIPELADIISSRTQDALDTLRQVRQQAQRQNHMLSAESDLEVNLWPSAVSVSA